MRIAALACVSALILSSVASADDAILIMDASRSMLGRVQGKRKVEIAREVVGELLGYIPQERRLGFVVYGHRHAEDCDDLEEVVPVGGDRLRIKRALDAIEAKGQTPLTAAVRFAAEKLGYTKNKATIILVSDGIESCHYDPCAAAAELEKSGIDLTVHVVGFGLKRGEIKGLECLADATGGRYFSANSAKELTRALQQTVADHDRPIDGAATLSGPAHVVEGSELTVSFTGPNNENDRITIARLRSKSDDRLTAVGPRTTRDGKALLLAPAEPGVYEVRYVHANGKILAKAPLEVTAGEATLQAPTSVGAGAKFEVRWTGPDSEHDLVRLCEPRQGAQDWLTQVQTHDKNGVETLIAPTRPGKYELRYLAAGEHILARAPLEIVDVTAKLTGPAKVVAGAEFEVKWTGPSNEVDKVYITELGSRPADWLSWSPTHDKNGTAELRAPLTPGKYEVRYVMYDERILDSFTIEVADGKARR